MDLEGRTERVFTLPQAFIAGRRLDRLATHLSLSADGRYFLLDGSFGTRWFVGTAELASGEFRLIREFDTHHNHALFSPVDRSFSRSRTTSSPTPHPQVSPQDTCVVYTATNGGHATVALAPLAD